MRCTVCGEPIVPKKRAKLGYKTCLQCAQAGTKRFLGRRGEKGIGIEIFRSDLTNIESYLSRENKNFGPGLGINSISHEEAMIKWKE